MAQLPRNYDRKGDSKIFALHVNKLNKLFRDWSPKKVFPAGQLQKKTFDSQSTKSLPQMFFSGRCVNPFVDYPHSSDSTEW